MLSWIVSSLVGHVTSYRYELVVPPPPPPPLRLPPPLWSGAEAAHFCVTLARDRQWYRTGTGPQRLFNTPALMDVTARTFPGLLRLALLWVARLSVTAQYGRWLEMDGVGNGAFNGAQAPGHLNLMAVGQMESKLTEHT